MEKKAVLVVSFGTSYRETLEKNIAAVEDEISRAMPHRDLYRVFTSSMIMKKLRERDGLDIPDAARALEELLNQGYSDVLVQPTHLMNGDEYDKLMAQARPFLGRFARLSFGKPLLSDIGDYPAVAQALEAWLPECREERAVVLMGHGTGHFANSAYTLLEYVFHDRGRSDVVIGTVEGYPTLDEVLRRLGQRPGVKRVDLWPLMVVAGDHAQNDMAGDGEDTWRVRLAAAGYEPVCHLEGLGENPGIRAIFAQHALAAEGGEQMKKGMLYGVGVGPGDPELLTLKAARILREADLVAVPDKGSGEKTALNIVKDQVEGKQLLYCPTPMVRDRDVLEAAYTEIADRLCALMDGGKTVAFITLGDPAVYSTYIYVHKKVLARGYEARLVPGVPSFCAVAAKLGVSLCEGDERLLIIPASHAVADCMDVRANKVFMKAGRDLARLRDQLGERGLVEKASMVANCGMDGERIFPRFADMEDGTGYFSVVLVKD